RGRYGRDVLGGAGGDWSSHVRESFVKNRSVQRGWYLQLVRIMIPHIWCRLAAGYVSPRGLSSWGVVSMRWIFGFLAVWGLFVMNGAPASAQCYGPGPCGPPGLEWMFPQGFAGADFRYACARHDMCYTYGAYGGRRACDQQF